MIGAQLRDLANGLEKARSSDASDELDRLLSEVCKLTHESGLLVEFNWIAWRPSGRLDREWIESASLTELRRFLTCHIQNGHLIEGHLRAAALDFDLIPLLERIADMLTVREEMDAPE
jgi:hypothetical protein